MVHSSHPYITMVLATSYYLVMMVIHPARLTNIEIRLLCCEGAPTRSRGGGVITIIETLYD